MFYIFWLVFGLLTMLKQVIQNTHRVRAAHVYTAALLENRVDYTSSKVVYNHTCID